MQTGEVPCPEPGVQHRSLRLLALSCLLLKNTVLQAKTWDATWISALGTEQPKGCSVHWVLVFLTSSSLSDRVPPANHEELLLSPAAVSARYTATGRKVCFRIWEKVISDPRYPGSCSGETPIPVANHTYISYGFFCRQRGKRRGTLQQILICWKVQIRRMY